MSFDVREEIDLDLIEKLTKFRWKIIKKEEVGYNTNKSLYGIKVVYTLSRSREIMNYTKITDLESEYFRLEDSIKKPKEIFAPALIFLFFLGILPGVIYFISNKVGNKKIEKNNKLAKKRMKEIIEETYIL